MRTIPRLRGPPIGARSVGGKRLPRIQRVRSPLCADPRRGSVGETVCALSGVAGTGFKPSVNLTGAMLAGMPCRPAALPAPAPLTIGVSLTAQVRPLSIERKTRAAVPPVANQTWLLPCTVMQVPLAANPPSPCTAGGRFSGATELNARRQNWICNQ